MKATLPVLGLFLLLMGAQSAAAQAGSQTVLVLVLLIELPMHARRT